LGIKRIESNFRKNKKEKLSSLLGRDKYFGISIISCP
jgi:hypothetical protein